jgi:7,8-dihydropterin-6-yl-methyl-4-(beta-D-ribofuranosyl)aminobenzene 5'-phosphate synthase
VSLQGTITVLTDNHASGPGLLAEHGLAVWLKWGTRCLLFDTGQTEALLANARQLGLDLGTVDTVVLSHGHYDHTGGLPDVCRLAPAEVVIYLHQDATRPKYGQADSGVRYIGMPARSLTLLCKCGSSLHTVTGPTEVAPDLLLTGEIPRRHAQEQADERFRQDAEGRHIDPFLDDQSLFLRTPAGTVVLLGCAHAGVINTLDYIWHLTDGHPIRAVLGGMHLQAASDERIAWTLEALQRFSIKELYPAHCTGAKAVAVLEAAFPGRCLPCGVGTTLRL